MPADPGNDEPLRSIGFNPLVARAYESVAAATGTLARVVEQFRTHCVLHTGVSLQKARAQPALLSETQLAVGDWVLAQLGAQGGESWITHRLPPYAQLIRIGADGAPQTLAMNVDCAFLVMGLDGDFNVRRLERYLALARSGGVLPIVVLTKADLCEDVQSRLDELAARLPAGIEWHAVNARDPAVAAILGPHLQAGHTAVLLGSSGAGKSTLTNTLSGSDTQKTADVRASDSRGRHTTTSRQLRKLPSGGCIIDTPGVRGLRLDTDEAALDDLFEDVQKLAADCRFRDCRHESEPGCAVRAALPADRLSNFHKMRLEVTHDRAGVLTKQASKARAKAQHRALRTMQKDERR